MCYEGHKCTNPKDCKGVLHFDKFLGNAETVFFTCDKCGYNQPANRRNFTPTHPVDTASL
jgi:hypothetical protein